MSTSSSSRRVFVVTGSNTGVGYQTALQLAQGDVDDNRHIILACRTVEKAQRAVDSIVATLPSTRGTIVEYMRLDLADLRSIESFIAEYKRRGLPLHVLVNNAGVNAPPKLAQRTFEMEGQWVANYLSHYVLTTGLLPILERSAPSRIINVSSYMHRSGSTDFATQSRKRSPISYSTSKLAQIFFSYELQRRYGSKGISVFVTHPGACNSDIWNTFRPHCLRRIVKPIAATIFLTTAQGAAPSVHAATKELTQLNEVECEHFGPYRTYEGWELFIDAWQPSFLTKVTKSKTSPVTHDPSIGAELMKLSESQMKEWQEAANKEESTKKDQQ